jgi:hypothetical protein
VILHAVAEFVEAQDVAGEVRLQFLDFDESALESLEVVGLSLVLLVLPLAVLLQQTHHLAQTHDFDLDALHAGLEADERPGEEVFDLGLEFVGGLLFAL